MVSESFSESDSKAHEKGFAHRTHAHEATEVSID